MARNLYLIVEGNRDIMILRYLLDYSKYDKVYHIPAGSYSSLSAVATTVRLMGKDERSEDKILVVFDSDSTNPSVGAEKTANIEYLTNADYDERMSVFCFDQDIEHCLFPQVDFKGLTNDEQSQLLQKDRDILKENPYIKELQKLIDS